MVADDVIRLALVITISLYDHLSNLPGVEEDQTAALRTLPGCGYECRFLLFRSTRRRLERGIADFANLIERVAAANPRKRVLVLFGFSGHGIQREGNQFPSLLCSERPSKTSGEGEIDAGEIFNMLFNITPNIPGLQFVFVFDCCRQKIAGVKEPELWCYDRDQMKLVHKANTEVTKKTPAGLHEDARNDNVILFGCGEGETSDEDHHGGFLWQAVFHHVLEGKDVQYLGIDAIRTALARQREGIMRMEGTRKGICQRPVMKSRVGLNVVPVAPMPSCHASSSSSAAAVSAGLGSRQRPAPVPCAASGDRQHKGPAAATSATVSTADSSGSSVAVRPSVVPGQWPLDATLWWKTPTWWGVFLQAVSCGNSVRSVGQNEEHELVAEGEMDANSCAEAPPQMPPSYHLAQTPEEPLASLQVKKEFQADLTQCSSSEGSTMGLPGESSFDSSEDEQRDASMVADHITATDASHIEIHDCNEADMERVMKTFPEPGRLEGLTITRCRCSGQVLARFLGSNLRRLCLDNWTPEGGLQFFMQQLQRLKHLTKLTYISKADATEFLTALAGLALEHLSLSCNIFLVAHAFAQVLPKLEQLRKVDLASGNPYNKDGALVLLNAYNKVCTQRQVIFDLGHVSQSSKDDLWKAGRMGGPPTNWVLRGG